MKSGAGPSPSGRRSLHKIYSFYFKSIWHMEDSCGVFVLYKQYPSGGMIWLMFGLDNSGSDYDDILAIAECLAKCGHEVIGTRYYRKCPDLLVDGDFVEYESYKTNQPKKAFRNMLHNGLEQSDSLIIRSCNLSITYMTRQIQGYAKKGMPVSQVWIYDGKEIRTLYNTVG